jgi:hypothetical protein
LSAPPRFVTQYGRPFTAEGFGNLMADWCREAGWPGLKFTRGSQSSGDKNAGPWRQREQLYGLVRLARYQAAMPNGSLSRENAHLLETNRVNKIPHLGSPNSLVRESGGKKARIINAKINGWRRRLDLG